MPVAAPRPEEIYSLRVRLNLTQTELARELGVESITVSRWERGLRQPSPMARRALTALLARTARDGDA